MKAANIRKGHSSSPPPLPPFARCRKKFNVQCLMDEERRADYDAMIGFSHLAVNPFQDTSFEADQVSVAPTMYDNNP
jgi:hypothetical protein